MADIHGNGKAAEHFIAISLSCFAAGGYRYGGIGDFNGEGYSDLVWSNRVTDQSPFGS